MRLLQERDFAKELGRFRPGSYLLYVPDGVSIEVDTESTPTGPTAWNLDGWGQNQLTSRAYIATLERKWVTAVIRRESYPFHCRSLIRAVFLLNKGARLDEPLIISGKKGWKKLNEWANEVEAQILVSQEV